MNGISTWIKVVAAAVGLIITVAGAMWGLEEHYTPRIIHEELSTEVAYTKKQVYIMQLEQQLRRLWDRVWMLEDRFGLQCENCPGEYFKEYNQLKFEIDRINRELERCGGGG